MTVPTILRRIFCAMREDGLFVCTYSQFNRNAVTRAVAGAGPPGERRVGRMSAIRRRRG
ncbi:MAG TPA: hypothetical protein VF491_02765 [Vicinamibacterales bacterium]